jgi:hypothetical protein
MDASSELLGEQRVDAAVARDERLTVEERADDDDLEVGLGALGHAVHAALVEDLEVLRRERHGELALDRRVDGAAHA